MTAYTSVFNTPPSGTNFLIGDTVTLTGGDVWKYAGNGQWVADASHVVTSIVDPVTGGIELLGLNGTISADDLYVTPKENRKILEGSAGIYQASGIYRAISRLSDRIARTTIYVSQDATNGFVVGSDANSGLSMQAPKLTLSGAYAAASNGDTVILNDSATPYDSAFYSIAKSITILPWSYRGVTLRSTNATFTFYIGANNVTFGAVVIDTNGVGASAVRANAQPCDNLRFIGTLIKSHSTYSVYTAASAEMSGGFETQSLGSNKSSMQFINATAGSIVIDSGSRIDGQINIIPTVSGVSAVIRGSSLAANNGQNILARGISSIIIEDNEIISTRPSNPTPIIVGVHATLVTDSVVIRRNRTRSNLAASAITVGYGIGVGEETAIAENILSVDIYDNVIEHANHGLFLAYGVKSGRAYGNVVRDSIIGLISKGNSNATVIHSNIVIGGPLTGGALRAKESTGAKFYNNLVIFDAQSVAAGSFEQADTTTTAADFANNILYAPSLTVSKATVVAVGSSATFRNNDYYAGSFGSTAFNYGASNYASVAAWSASQEATATSIDPLFVDAIWDYRLGASSPLRQSAAAVGVPVDFFGDKMGAQVGPMPAI